MIDLIVIQYMSHHDLELSGGSLGGDLMEVVGYAASLLVFYTKSNYKKLCIYEVENGQIIKGKC